MAQVVYHCTMQEGQIGAAQRVRLADGLVKLTGRVLGVSANEVAVAFSDIPRGYGFRGGEPSTTSLVRGSIQGGLGQSVRVDLMRAICDMWMELSGCSVDELVVTARDA